MKKLIAGTKGKVVGATLVGALVFGGGAAVGASYDFGTHLSGVANSLSSKVASFTGKTVDERQKIEANEVADKVVNENDKAANDVASHTYKETTRGMDEVDSKGEEYKQEIEEAFAKETAKAKDKITQSVDHKLTETDGDLDSAAYGALEAADKELTNLVDKTATNANAKAFAETHAK